MCSPQYYQLIEECVSQIVLHKNGIDPDFRGHFTLDVEPLLAGMSNREQVQAIVAQVESLQKLLDTERAARIESDAHLKQQVRFPNVSRFCCLLSI